MKMKNEIWRLTLSKLERLRPFQFLVNEVATLGGREKREKEGENDNKHEKA